MTVKIERYNKELKNIWNQFIQGSKNGLFLFERGYMEYHADRFSDHSLLFYNCDELVCVLPANEKDGTFYSHGGLTFGGFVMSRRASTVFLLHAVTVLIEYLKEREFSFIIYKSIPSIYHQLPAQEDAYALFNVNAQLYRRDVSSVIDLSQKISYTKGTKSNLSKARKNGLQVQQSQDFETFVHVLEHILRTKYNTKPTHNANELQILSSRFPDNIKLYMVYKGSECLGGTILYITEQVAHTQYIGITDEGKEVGALDFLTDSLIQMYLGKKKYFSFGISTEQEGRFLNEGLIRNKESFGARAIVHDFYKLALN